jgi:penicillin-binding protein 2
VRLTIDIDLQRAIEDRFAHPLLDNKPEAAMYGAAVVIDVPTGQIRALVSYPTYDINDLDQLYPRLVRDDINRPLMNRATQFALEPGSTVKPIVGIGAITEGLLKPYEGIECTGYLVLNGKRYTHEGKCWTMGGRTAPMHHLGHQGTHGNPDGFLTYPEALQRSCNVFFETLADRLGIDRLSLWMERFGLGRPVGIGLPEAAGMRPDSYKGPAFLRSGIITWTGAIGQNHVAATPLQMANVAALELNLTLKPDSGNINRRFGGLGL